MSTPNKPKIIAVVGPTASGKSELAVTLAKKFKGEIISCDSRQIFIGMDIGTGKVEGKWKSEKNQLYETKKYVYKGIRHYLIDFVDPKKDYSVALFQKQAKRIIQEILWRGRLPILCGGTGHWADAVVFGQVFPDIKPNLPLRKRLEKESAEKLFKKLSELDPSRAANIDKHNKRRIIRALEIINATGEPVPNLVQQSRYNALWVGINPPQEVLYEKIEKRLKQRIKQGMVKEMEKLYAKGVSYKKLMDFGLEYKYCSLFLQNRINKEQMFEQLLYAIKHYAKRQLTWFKRNKRINWLSFTKQKEALEKASFELVSKFLQG